MTEISVEWLKWPATPYRVTPMTRLGADEQGTWLFAPRGAKGHYEATGPALLPVNFLTLLPTGEQWWMCTWMWGNPAIDIGVYVDIVHPPGWLSESRLRVVDLDLDVIRHHDGRVLIDDEDELSEHSASLNYPAAVISSARRTAGQVFDSVAARTPPFDRPPDRWLKALPEDAREAEPQLGI